MIYIVSAYLDGHWQTLLATSDLDHAKQFKREIRGVRTRLSAIATRKK